MSYDIGAVIPLAESAGFELSPLQVQWIEALESGKYKQDKGALRRAQDGGFCCLGVLCEVMGMQWEERDAMPRWPGDSDPRRIAGYIVPNQHALENCSLWPELEKQVGVCGAEADFKEGLDFPGVERTCTSLMSANDDMGMTFLEIAQLMRHDPARIFYKAA